MGTILATDNFNRTNLADNPIWNSIPAGWSIVGNALNSATAANGTFLLASTVVLLHNVEVSATFTPVSSGGGIVALDSGSANGWLLYSTSTTQVSLYKITSGLFNSPLVGVTVAAGAAKYTLRVEGPYVTMLRAGVVIGTYFDTTLTGCTRGGFYSNNNSASRTFDDFEVGSSDKGEVLFTDDFNRANSSTLNNGWTNTGWAIGGNTLNTASSTAAADRIVSNTVTRFRVGITPTSAVGIVVQVRAGTGGAVSLSFPTSTTMAYSTFGVGGSESTVTTGSHANQLYELEHVGTSLKFYRNGVLFGTKTVGSSLVFDRIELRSYDTNGKSLDNVVITRPMSPDQSVTPATRTARKSLGAITATPGPRSVTPSSRAKARVVPSITATPQPVTIFPATLKRSRQYGQVVAANQGVPFTATWNMSSLSPTISSGAVSCTPLSQTGLTKFVTDGSADDAGLSQVYNTAFTTLPSTGWTYTGTAWQISSGRVQPSGDTGTTSYASYGTPANTVDHAITFRVWRATQRGNTIMCLAGSGGSPSSNSVNIVASFDVTTTLLVRQTVGGNSVNLGTIPYTNGQLVYAAVVGNTVQVSVDGGAVTTFTLPTARNAADRYVNYSASTTTTPRFQYDDLTIYDIVAAPTGPSTEPFKQPRLGTTNTASSFNAAQYFEFTMSSAVDWNPGTLTLNASRAGSSTPRSFEIRTSADSYATSVLSVAGVPTQIPAYTSYSASLPAATRSTPLTVRVYPYSNSPTAGLNFDDFVFSGSHATVPGQVFSPASRNKNRTYGPLTTSTGPVTVSVASRTPKLQPSITLSPGPVVVEAASRPSMYRASPLTHPQRVFTPPTVTRRPPGRGIARFQKLDVGIAVLRNGTFFSQHEETTPELLAAADAVYLGGRTHPVDDQTYLDLIAAGYAANVGVAP